jgi:hypothetical protein
MVNMTEPSAMSTVQLEMPEVNMTLTQSKRKPAEVYQDQHEDGELETNFEQIAKNAQNGQDSGR